MSGAVKTAPTGVAVQVRECTYLFFNLHLDGRRTNFFLYSQRSAGAKISNLAARIDLCGSNLGCLVKNMFMNVQRLQQLRRRRSSKGVEIQIRCSPKAKRVILVCEGKNDLNTAQKHTFNRGLSHAINGEIELADCRLFTKRCVLKPDWRHMYTPIAWRVALNIAEIANSVTTANTTMGLDVIIASDEIRIL